MDSGCRLKGIDLCAAGPGAGGLPEIVIVLEVEPDIGRVLAKGLADADGHLRRNSCLLVEHTGKSNPGHPKVRGKPCDAHRDCLNRFLNDLSWMGWIVHPHICLLCAGTWPRRRLVVVPVVHQNCIVTFETERQAPVSADLDSPMSGKLLVQRVQVPAGNVHSPWTDSAIQRRQLESKLFCMGRIDAGSGAIFEKLFEPRVPEGLDHKDTVSLSDTTVKSHKSRTCDSGV